MNRDPSHAVRDDLLARVARVAPLAAERARASEEGRTLAPDVAAALREEGLFHFVAPRAAGGLDADPLVQLEVFEAMARADGSAGWCLMIGALSTAMAAAYLPDRGAAAVFERGAPVCAGLLAPAGLARRVAGGFEIEGRWGFGSGIRHADWVLTSAVVASDEPPTGPFPEMITVVIPVRDVTIESSWFASGLKGSGSEHYRIERKVVPADYAFPFPFAPARRGGPFFDLPFFPLLLPAHVGFALGAARGAIDAIVRAAPLRVKTWSRAPLADNAAFHAELGRAQAKLAAARAYAFEVIGAHYAKACKGAPLSPEDWPDARLLTTHVTDVAADVATFAYRQGGASALYDESPLQRSFRDVFAATQHVSATDDAYEAAGRSLLGKQTPEPLLMPRPARP